MKTGHLTDDAIQQYVLGASNCEADIIEHIDTCETCSIRLANYRLLFAAIQEQPKPAFEFDVAGLVLSQLQGKTKELTRMDRPLYLLITAFFCLMGVPLYYFRKDIAIMFATMLPITIGLITISTIPVLVFQGIDLFKKYKLRSDALNY